MHAVPIECPAQLSMRTSQSTITSISCASTEQQAVAAVHPSCWKIVAGAVAVIAGSVLQGQVHAGIQLLAEGSRDWICQHVAGSFRRGCRDGRQAVCCCSLSRSLIQRWDPGGRAVRQTRTRLHPRVRQEGRRKLQWAGQRHLHVVARRCRTDLKHGLWDNAMPMRGSIFNLRPQTCLQSQHTTWHQTNEGAPCAFL